MPARRVFRPARCFGFDLLTDQRSPKLLPSLRIAVLTLPCCSIAATRLDLPALSPAERLKSKDIFAMAHSWCAYYSQAGWATVAIFRGSLPSLLFVCWCAKPAPHGFQAQKVQRRSNTTATALQQNTDLVCSAGTCTFSVFSLRATSHF